MWSSAIFLATSLICSSVVLADKNDIIMRTASEPWLSTENLKTLIEVSFDFARCCNIYIHGESAVTRDIFNKFVQIYPYEYTVNKRIYDCYGYFMISTSARQLVAAMTKVPTTISTTEILIIVDEDIDESKEVLNGSTYANSNVNIAARNGLWRLSENFLDPRMFKMVSRHDQMRHKHGVADLQGRELQVAAFFSPPFCYLETTVNRTVKGIEGEFYLAKKKTEFDGIEVKIFTLIADRLNFTWTIRKPNNFYRYGRQNGSSWNGGMIGQLFRKEIDMAFTAIWMTWDHASFVNLTKPWTQMYVHFLVPRPKPYENFWALGRPLSGPVWAATVTILIVQSLFVYITARINPRTPKKFQSFTVTWTEMMGRLLGTSAPRHMEGLELQFQLWHFIGVLLVTAYSSSLAASLTSPEWEPRIDTPQQFIEANLSWGREGPTPFFEKYFDYSDKYARQIPLRYSHETGNEERHQKILKGKYAVVGRIVGSIFYPENYIYSSDLKGLRLMKQAVSKFYSSFAVQPWLIEPVDTVMLWLRETGLVTYHLRDVLHRRTKIALREVLIERDGKQEDAKPLRLFPLGAGFVLYFFGILVSTIVFYFELKSVSGRRPIRDVFRRIKRNREIYRRLEELERQYQRKVDIELKREKYAFIFRQTKRIARESRMYDQKSRVIRVNIKRAEKATKIDKASDDD